MKRERITYTAALLATALPVVSHSAEIESKRQKSDRPNVIVILTDDQGYGDLGFTGNPIVKTPNIDKLASESIFLTDFSVSPVSAPTRSSLMTGRESLRTGVCDTYNGGCTMAASETTMAEVLKSAGYSTAIFGKWHLGDNYPCRAMDQGFDEALVLGGGGMGQPGDFFNFPKGDSSYFDPTLWHNGIPVETKGYCSDVFGDATVEYIENNNQESPFFIYLSFNAPHDPLQLPQEYYDMYKDCDPTAAVGDTYMPKMGDWDIDSARKVYGMVTNIDDNVGKVMDALKRKGIDDNTLVIFMTDNGPLGSRYNGGFSRMKGSPYQGGVRVPCIMHLPSRFKAKEIAYPSAHIDILPTVASICNASLPESLEIDGENILPKIEQGVQSGHRTFVHSWVRRGPIPYRNMSIRDGDFKLVANLGREADIKEFELYNIGSDISEQKNIIEENIPLATSLKEKIDIWYRDIIGSENIYNSPIVIGTKHENPSYLNRNDALGEEGLWTQENIYGYWSVDIAESGQYDITCVFIKPLSEAGKLNVTVGNVWVEQDNSEVGISEITMSDVYLTKGEGQLRPWYVSPGKESRHSNTLPLYVKVTKR